MNTMDWSLWQPQQLERRALRRQSNLAAYAVLLMLGVQQILLPLLQLLLSALGVNFSGLRIGTTAYLLYYAVLYTLMMGLPVLCCALINRRKTVLFPVRRVGAGTAVMVALGGMALCVMADFFVSYSTAFFNSLGFYYAGSPSLQDGTVTGLLLNILTIALLPAILEEMLFRGYVLQTLRPLGDGAAVFGSALLFALMHTNIVQIPFALLLGLVFGFLVVRTSNILLSMILHFLNNTMSVVLEYVTLHMDADTANVVVLTTFVVIGCIGLVALTVLLVTHHPVTRPLGDSARTLLSKGSRYAAMLLAPAMIVSFVLIAILTIQNTEVRPVSMSMDEMTLTSGQEVQLTVNQSVFYSTGQKPIWRSSNQNVATVDQNGWVEALRAGQTTIAAYYPDGNRAICTVTVQDSAPAFGDPASSVSLWGQPTLSGCRWVFTPGGA